MTKQKTIAQSATLNGIGLHTGNESSITFHPAPENYGFRFVRTDLPGEPEIPALVDYVVDISRGTTLEFNGARVHTVEHVLAALVGLDVDNCRIELTANEPPIGDGSSLPFVEALQRAGVVEQKAAREYFTPEQTIHYKNDEKGVEIVALPNDEYRVTVMIDYHNPALGSQHTGLFNMQKEFATEFAPARTFCFLHEVEMLHSQGLIKGGNLDNAVVIVDKEMSPEEMSQFTQKFGINQQLILEPHKPLNNKALRFKNEPARHKLLDLIGDLALAGVRVKAQVLAARPGHASNIEFAKLVRQLYKKHKEVKRLDIRKDAQPVMNIQAILKVAPHRYPFLMIDRVIDFDRDLNRIVAMKNVTVNEPFFQGHFPERPIMPGVMILEAMAQTGGFLLLDENLEFDPSKLVMFLGIDKAKFRRPVVPGDQLFFEVTLISKRFGTLAFEARAWVDDTIVAEAELKAAIVDRSQLG